MKLLGLFLCFTLLSFSQTKTVKGIVFDDITKLPIPYVNLSILESQIGTSSLEDGSYSLEITDKNLDKKIHLSSLGYRDSIISVNQLLKQSNIYLQAKFEELDEIIISKKFQDQFLVVNPIKRKYIKSGFSTSTNPWKIALFFPFKEDYKSTKYLNSVKIYLQQYGLTESHPSKFRLRLFSIGEDDLPKDDLIIDEILIETKKRQKDVEVDMSKHNIIFPKDGFYVVLEWLHIPFNEFEMTYTMQGEKGKKKMTKYAPTFSATKEELNTFKVAYFSNGKWFNFPIIFKDENKQSVPAISLTLSN